jgi:PAS domain-containing protein
VVSAPTPEPSSSGHNPGPPPPRADRAPTPEALLGFFRRLTAALAEPGNRDRILQSAAEAVDTLIDRSSAAVALLESAADAVLVRAGTGLLRADIGEWIPLEGTLEGEALASGEPRVSEDLPADPRTYLARERSLDHAGPAVVLPLSGRAGMHGVLVVVRERGEPAFCTHEVEGLRVAAEAVASALDNTQSYHRTRRSRERLDAWRREREARRWLDRFAEAARVAQQIVFEWELNEGRFGWSDTVEEVLGIPAEGLGARFEEWVERVHPDDREALRKILDQAQWGHTLGADVRLFHANGFYRPLRLRMAPRSDDRTRVIGSFQVIAGRGPTSHPEGGPEGGQAPPTPVQIVRALRHEINNPLAVVLGEAQLLSREPVVVHHPEIRRAVDSIHFEAQRIHELTRRLASLENAPDEMRIGENGGLQIGKSSG